MKKIQYIFKVLKCVVFRDVFKFSKTTSQNAGNGISGTLDLKMFPGAKPRTHLDISRAFFARFVPPVFSKWRRHCLRRQPQRRLWLKRDLNFTI